MFHGFSGNAFTQMQITVFVKMYATRSGKLSLYDNNVNWWIMFTFVLFWKSCIIKSLKLLSILRMIPSSLLWTDPIVIPFLLDVSKKYAPLSKPAAQLPLLAIQDLIPKEEGSSFYDS